MAKNKDVSFIRKGGRVIPIRKKDAGKQLVKRPGSPPRPKPKKRESKFKAAGLVGTGVLASLFGGSAIAEFSKEATHKKEAGKNLFQRGTILKDYASSVEEHGPGVGKSASELKKQAKTFTRAGAFHRARGHAVGKQGRFIGTAAIGIGATLVGMGLSEAYEQLVGRQTSDTEKVVTQVAGTVATTAAAFEFGKKAGVSVKVARRMLAQLLVK